VPADCPYPPKDSVPAVWDKPLPRLAATPLAIAKAPLIVVEEVKVIVPVMAKVRLLKVVAEAESVWLPGAAKITVPVPGVKSDPVPPQAVGLVELSLIVLEPPFNVPAVRVISPVNV